MGNALPFSKRWARGKGICSYNYSRELPSQLLVETDDSGRDALHRVRDLPEKVGDPVERIPTGFKSVTGEGVKMACPVGGQAPQKMDRAHPRLPPGKTMPGARVF